MKIERTRAACNSTSLENFSLIHNVESPIIIDDKLSKEDTTKLIEKHRSILDARWLQVQCDLLILTHPRNIPSHLIRS